MAPALVQALDPTNLAQMRTPVAIVLGDADTVARVLQIAMQGRTAGGNYLTAPSSANGMRFTRLTVA